MANIVQIRDFQVPPVLGASYERLVEGLKAETFGLAVKQAIESHTRGARRLYLYEAWGGDNSRLQYHSCEPGIAALFPLYHHYRRHDPVCHAYRAAPHMGDVVMQLVRPSDIDSADFRRHFFDDAGIIERLSIVQRGPTGWRAMNLARHRLDGGFTDDELSNILGLASLALPLLALNREHSGRSLSVDKLEARFNAVCPKLTLRERQVCARAAKGMSVEATALDLRIGKTTVQTFRRRAYSRLGIASAIELCSLALH